MATTIISSFKGVGATKFCAEQNKMGSTTTVLCLDVRDYKYDRYIQTCTYPFQPNPAYHNNYIQAIKENIGKVDFLFIDAYEEVRHAMRANNIPYVLIYPDKSLRDDWAICMLRNICESSHPHYPQEIITNWDKLITSMDNDDFPRKLKIMSAKNYTGLDLLIANRCETLE